MRDYELIFIVHPDLEDQAFEGLVDKVKGWITEEGGQVAKVDIWGQRKLAYPIRKKNEGKYVFIETKLPPTACASLERNLRILEPVMRFLITRKE